MYRPNKNSSDKTYKILPDKGGVPTESLPSTSKPLHVQRVEAALKLDGLLKSVDNQYLQATDSDSDDAAVKNEIDNLLKESDSYSHKDYFNFSDVSTHRKWLADILQEDLDDKQELPYDETIKWESHHKVLLKNDNVNLNQYMYYGTGLISNVDKYPEIEKTLPTKTLKKKNSQEDQPKSPLYLPSEILEDISNEPCLDINFDHGLDFQNIDEDSNVNSDFGSASTVQVTPGPNVSNRKRGKKFKDEESKKKWEDMMTLKRRKVLISIAKKEVGKQHRSKMNRHKETLIQCKRVAQHCLKYVRQKALLSARIVKEQPWRMKRLSRENIAYWKRSRRFDREVKKRMEKEAEEQRKMDHELVEAKRQQRKLNFLITQTELYAHFMSRKLGQVSAEEQLLILSQLDEERNSRLSIIDDYDSASMKEKAKRNAQEAFQSEKLRTKHFDLEANSSIMEPETYIDGEHSQPLIFRGKLKGYQLRGMNWLANLYSQGISGILADEMGLGKTVQSIAFLCHIAERYSVWGPFLIISPASTLHNWQQEIAKFVPHFKVVPYWGNPNERKILRQFWDQKDIYTKDASFHIVITSYQIVITDIKYFNRIKWQYMILDEAQAIKSTSSMRWKTLLGFSCRNRLLLSGTPIQNSMAELWALLHFIMPTLFDSHEEFNEWFSKDIESHAENKTGIDEKHLSRLHMILKPFMLRRIKKDVENELSDKIEIMVYCPLTTRQKLLYMALKQKIKIEDLLHYTVGGGDSHTVDKNFTSNLMNLVMQFRKVCNHPELFERRDAKSPICLTSCQYTIPFLVFDANVRLEYFLKLRKLLLWNPDYIASVMIENFGDSIFNFCIALKLSFQDLYLIFAGNILHRWKTYYEMENRNYRLYMRKPYYDDVSVKPSIYFRHELKLCEPSIDTSKILTDFVFTRKNTASRVVYTYTDHYYHSMPETVEHKNIRLKLLNANTNASGSLDDEAIIDVVNEESISTEEIIHRTNPVAAVADFVYRERPSHMFPCQKTEIPSFLFCAMPKISTSPLSLYCYSRRAAWQVIRHKEQYSYRTLNHYWSQATGITTPTANAQYFIPPEPLNAIDVLRRVNGWSYIAIPDKETLVTDSGKLSVLDSLLKRLKEEGHRVLIYSQMTKMIDLLEEYMWHRHHKYMRLDGSSKISERRDMVADFQARTDIFVFLLSTRAGGLGINLTAADTVIFYDSDWNPTVDQQAMDRAHRLGQTKQVTVYRLICKGSIEERILQRAREKSEIQKLVISGGNFKPDTLKPKEVVSLLLDDDELVQKYNLKVEGGRPSDDAKEAERKRKYALKTTPPPSQPEAKKPKDDPPPENRFETQWASIDSCPNSPRSLNSPDVTASEDLNESGFLDDTDSSLTSKYTVYNVYGSTVKPRAPVRGASRRGRPRGSRRVNSLNRTQSSISQSTTTSGFSTSMTEPLSGETSPSSSTSSVVSANILDPSAVSTTSFSPSCTVRRGPGRPRLKPGGPANAGSRGTYRPRKPARPLPVPLPSDGPNVPSSSATTSSTPSCSSYMYDFDVLFAKNQNDA